MSSKTIKISDLDAFKEELKEDFRRQIAESQKDIIKQFKKMNIDESRTTKEKKSRKGTRSMSGYNLYIKENQFSDDINEQLKDFSPSDKYLTKAKPGKEPKQMNENQVRMKLTGAKWRSESKDVHDEYNSRAKEESSSKKDSIDVKDIVDESIPQKSKKKSSKKKIIKKKDSPKEESDKDESDKDESDKDESDQDEHSSSSIEVDSDDSDSSDSE